MMATRFVERELPFYRVIYRRTGMLLSLWYLRRWKMGPAEWLWRLVTYLKIPAK